MLLALVLFLALAAVAIRPATITHLVRIVIVVGAAVGPVTDFTSGYVTQAKAR